MKINRILSALLLFAVALLVLPILATAADPVPVSIVAGKKVVFSYTVEKGTPPFTQQWLKDGQPIPGATGATYTIPRVSEADAGVYSVRVSNTAGSTISDEAPIVLIVPPSGAKVNQAVSDPDPGT